jgi:hypothetical protein
MSDTHDHTRSSHEGYEITFHPAFASRCVVQCAGCDEVEVYRQTKPHVLNGKKKPKKHVIHLKGGPNRRDIRIAVDDAKHHVHKITIELYPEDHDAEKGMRSDPVETVTMFNDALLCPPHCGDR